MDPKQALAEAFRRLDVFFIEGVGTFRKLKEPARVESGRVMPPALRVVLETGQSAGAVPLSQPLQEWAQLDAIAATSLVQLIAGWIRSTVQATGRFLIPQVGEIVADRNGGYKLDSPTVAPPLFGLAELELTLNRQRKEKQAEPQPEKEEKKEKAAIAEPPAEPLPPVEVVEAEPKPRKERKIVKEIAPRRSGAALPIFKLLFAVLLIGGAAAGYIFREEIKTKLTEWGWIGGSNAPADSSLAHIDSIPVPDTGKGHHSGQIEPGDGSDLNGKVKGELLAVAPIPGMHYFVIASVKDEAIATRSVNEMRTAGMKVTVLQKEWAEGFYKITTFESSNRMKVIDQMVKYKDKYPESWIYPPMR